MAWTTLLLVATLGFAPARPELLTDYYTLYATAPDSADGSAPGHIRPAEVLGAARWTRADGHHGGRYLELDLYLLREDARLLLSEESYAGSGAEPGGLSAKLVWREMGENGRRMLVLERPLDGAEPMRWRDACGGDMLHGRRPIGASGIWPLGWTETLRQQHRTSGEFALFSPLANRARAIEIRGFAVPLPWLHSAAPGFLRCVESRRRDGSLHRRYLFAGEALLAFSLGEDGPVAVRTGRESYLESVPTGARAGDVAPVPSNPSPVPAEAAAPRTR